LGVAKLALTAPWNSFVMRTGSPFRAPFGAAIVVFRSMFFPYVGGSRGLPKCSDRSKDCDLLASQHVGGIHGDDKLIYHTIAWSLGTLCVEVI
jgi:hypothetical protein